MGALAIADLVLKLMGKINLGLEEGRRFYDAVRVNNPDMPERTDAEVIETMKAKFTSNKQIAEAARAALRNAPAPQPPTE